MIFQTFDELLHLDVTCELAWSPAASAALLILGDRADVLAKRLSESAQVNVERSRIRVLFGLPILTAPFPLFVGAMMTERNAILDQLSLFGWIEDHAIEQPRAEVFGLTPFAEQPVLFLRDFDMDRPVEAWFQSLQPARWLRVVGVAIATAREVEPRQTLEPDRAALAAMAFALPPDVRPFVESLALDVARGVSLKVALRHRRKTTDAALMNACDGWRVLSRAAVFVRLDPLAGGDQRVEDVLKLAPPKRW